ncbi:MAG: hypothetical protein HYV40_06715 [Candidatus Levybacteria bacterium]|nr:hypothetical protein [Candidatus Levybacteria bacterium]
MTSEDKKRWIKSIVIACTIFLLLSLYLFIRRGYYDLYIINKVFGSSAVILAGITLLIGPLRQFSFGVSLMTIRRHLGLLAFGFAIVHILASLYQSNRFIWFSWYLNEWIPVSAGFFAIALLAYMTYISRNKKIQELGPDVWKNRLSIAGKLSFLAIFLHLTIMKYQGWIRWFNGEVKQSQELANPTYPPASLFVFFLMLTVIIFRIVHWFTHKGKVKSNP